MRGGGCSVLDELLEVALIRTGEGDFLVATGRSLGLAGTETGLCSICDSLFSDDARTCTEETSELAEGGRTVKLAAIAETGADLAAKSVASSFRRCSFKRWASSRA